MLGPVLPLEKCMAGAICVHLFMWTHTDGARLIDRRVYPAKMSENLLYQGLHLVLASNIAR